MFITEHQNIGDSVLFLLSARSALANVVEASSVEKREELISFIHNEASDYEIMHLLLKGSFPKHKYNTVSEMLLFSNLKESMLINKDFIIEAVGQELFDNVLNEVDSLYGQTSTARSILEVDMTKDKELAMAFMINESVNLLKDNVPIVEMSTDTNSISESVRIAKEKAQHKYNIAKEKLSTLSYRGLSKGAVPKRTITLKFATLILLAGAKIYKRYFSKAAKSCGGMRGKAKTNCMANFKDKQ